MNSAEPDRFGEQSRNTGRRVAARRRFPLFIWPLLAVGGQALCLWQALS
ncbi:hypothetical protein [Nocardia sp. NPDC051750]